MIDRLSYRQVHAMPEKKDAHIERLIRGMRRATYGLLGTAAMLLYLGQHMYRDQQRNVELERAVEPKELAWEAAKDLLPGDFIEGMHNSHFNVPADIGEACWREAYDLMLQSEYDNSEQLAVAADAISHIEVAGSMPEVLVGAQIFFEANNISLSYYGHETTVDSLDGEVGLYLPNYYAFDDRDPESTQVAAEYFRSTIQVMSLFPRQFLDNYISDVVYLGDRRMGASAASAHDGVRNNQALVFELSENNHDRDTVWQQAIVAHEVAHAFQERVARENKLYFDDDPGMSFGGVLADGAEYYVHDVHRGGVDLNLVTETPERQAARPYGLKNHREHGATTTEDMLYEDGLVPPHRADFNNIYMLDQVNHALCLEIMMPGFVDAVLIPRAIGAGEGITSKADMDAVYGGGVEGLLALRQQLVDLHFSGQSTLSD